MQALFLAVLFAAALPASAALPDRPASGRVLDQTGSISEAGRARIQGVSDELESRTGAELAVAVVKTLDGMDPADYANRLFKAWGVGKKGRDNGVLILVSPADRKSRIEVGYGLEAKLPDIVAGRLLKDELRPYFQEGRFEDGVLFGARRVEEIVSGSPASGEPPPRPRPHRSASSGDAPWFLIPFLAIFVVLGASAVGAALGVRNASSIFLLIWGGMFGGIPMFMAYAALAGGGFGFLALLWAAAAVAGFRYGSKHPEAFKNSGRGGSGGWSSSSGDYGGGWSGGSGGGSDFGGGSSGGGGASDSW